MTELPPEHLIDWRGHDWDPSMAIPPAHPNARFTAPAEQCPVIADEWQDPRGVPLSAILFGGRRASNVPLVSQAFDWEHGTFLGATMSSEKTAAASGAVGTLRRDPMAMLPFCGYHMGDYFAHWLDIGERFGPTAGRRGLPGLPGIFYVNWFRKSPDGKWLWPGFGENSRVLAWVLARVHGEADAVESPIGWLPRLDDESLPLDGLDLDAHDLAELMSVPTQRWLDEMPDLREHLARFGDRLPAALHRQADALEQRLKRSGG